MQKLKVSTTRFKPGTMKKGGHIWKQVYLPNGGQILGTADTDKLATQRLIRETEKVLANRLKEVGLLVNFLHERKKLS